MTYSFDYPGYNVTFKGNEQQLACAFVRVECRYLNGQHSIASIHFKGNDVTDLFKAFAPKAMQEFLLFGKSCVFCLPSVNSTK